MSFLSGAFLFGLAAVAVPIVLHLIYRQRYPERRFTTLRFFDVTIKHNVIQRRLIDRLLLALRVLVLAALMLALSRPFWSAGVGDRSLSMVVIFDNSPSMGRKQGGVSLFEKGREAALGYVKQLKPGDRAAVLLTCPSFEPAFTTDRALLERVARENEGQPFALLARGTNGAVALVGPALLSERAKTEDAVRRAPAGAPLALVRAGGRRVEPFLTADLGVPADDLARATLAGRSGRVRETVEVAARLLGRSGGMDRVLVIVSDLQKGEWASGEAAEIPGAKVVVAALAADGAGGVNLSLEECVLPSHDVHFGQSVVCAARIRNAGQVVSTAASLMVDVAGQPQPVKVAVNPIAPGASALVPFVIHASARGRTLFGTARVESPAETFTYDNTCDFQVPVVAPVRILCVNGTTGQDAGARSGFYLVNALSPRGAGAVTEVFADVEECGVEDLKGRELFQYNVILLAGVETLDKPFREKLRAFAEDGGGLFVSPGPRTTAEECNGWGFLPARVAEMKTGEAVFVRSLAGDEPLMADLALRMAGSLRGLSSGTWARLEPEGKARVLAELSNGSPAIVAGRKGKGRVVMTAAGCHVESGSQWPLRPAFVILVRGMVTYLAATEESQALAGDRLAGEGMAMPIPNEMAGGTPGAFRLEVVNGQLRYAPLAWYPGAAHLLLPPMERPGHVVLSVQPSRELGVLGQPGLGAVLAPAVMRGSGAESVLAGLTAAEAKGRFRAAGVEVKEAGREGLPTLDEMSGGREVWRMLAWLALGAVFVEGLLAWRTVSGAAGDGGGKPS